jgi:hypothetical protein
MSGSPQAQAAEERFRVLIDALDATDPDDDAAMRELRRANRRIAS